jgi:hypothetical protein
MVVPEEVQHTVHHEQCELVVERPGVRRALGDRHGRADDDVTEQYGNVDEWLVVHGKREHVGWTILTHEAEIQFGDLGAIDEGQREFARPAFLIRDFRGECSPPLDVDGRLIDLVSGAFIGGDDAARIHLPRHRWVFGEDRS